MNRNLTDRRAKILRQGLGVGGVAVLSHHGASPPLRPAEESYYTSLPSVANVQESRARARLARLSRPSPPSPPRWMERHEQ